MKKLTALLLAVLMLCLPLFSIAETDGFITEAYLAGKTVKTDISFEVADDSLLTMVEALSPVKDLLNSLSISSVMRTDATNPMFYFALRLNGEDAITYQGERNDGGLLLGSNLLGDKLILLNEKENSAFAKLLASVADADEKELLTALNTAFTTQPQTAVTFELTEAQQNAIKQYVKEEAVSENSGAYDPAVKSYSFDMTGAQVMELAKQFNVTNTLTEEQTAKVDQLKISGKFLVNEQDDLVYGEMTVTPPATKTEQSLKFQYARKTAEAGIAHAFEIGLSTDDTPAMSGTLLEKDGQLNGKFELKQKDSVMATISITRTGEKTDTNAQSLTTLDVDASGMQAKIQTASTSAKDGDDAEYASLTQISAMGSPVLKIKVQSTTKDAAVPAMDAAKAVHFSEMDEAGLETFKKEVEQSAKTAVVALMQKLPASLLKLMQVSE